MRKEECKPGVAVTFEDYIYNRYISHQVPIYGIIYSNVNIILQEGIVTRHRIIEKDEHEYRYTIEFGKRKKIYLTKSKIGVMLTNGTLEYKYPEELERKTKENK